MENKNILLDVRDNVAHIILNRPDVANTLDEEMSREFMQVIIRCSEEPMVRAILISGAGRMFCGGGDLKKFSAQGEYLSSHLKEIAIYSHVVISGLLRLEAPVIAAVHGSAAGAGMSLACACDIVVAAENTRFTTGYTRVGLSPDWSSTYLLPRLVGLRRALELLMTNRVLTAQEALEWGIVTQVLPEAEFLEKACALAVQLAAGPTKALGAAKRLLYSGYNESLETQMENESQAISSLGYTADAHEGITAFLEKRAASFIGK